MYPIQSSWIHTKESNLVQDYQHQEGEMDVNTRALLLFRRSFPQTFALGCASGNNPRVGPFVGRSTPGFAFLALFLDFVLPHWVLEQDLASLDAALVKLSAIGRERHAVLDILRYKWRVAVEFYTLVLDGLSLACGHRRTIWRCSL